MDIATIGGLAIGAFVVLLAIFMGSGIGGVTAFINMPSVLITFGGSFCALMASHPLSRTLGLMKLIRIATKSHPMDAGRVISMIVTFSEKARREGLLALEDDLDELEDDFLRKGIQLVVDGTDPEIIRNIMETELNNMQTRHSAGIKVFDDWSTLAPAFGMIGTLIGLILMLRNIEDKAQIGPNMAVALITTFYGALACYLIFIPISNKLAHINEQEILLREIMIEGTLSIQSGDNPRIVKEKLVSFLTPEVRAQIDEETGLKE
jgi:chemotaxis protein MotA